MGQGQGKPEFQNSKTDDKYFAAYLDIKETLDTNTALLKTMAQSLDQQALRLCKLENKVEGVHSQDVRYPHAGTLSGLRQRVEDSQTTRLQDISSSLQRQEMRMTNVERSLEGMRVNQTDTSLALLQKIHKSEEHHETRLAHLERKSVVGQQSFPGSSKLVHAPAAPGLRDDQMQQLRDFLSTFLPQQMTVALRESRSSLGDEIKMLQTARQEMTENSKRNTLNYQLCAVFAHILKKVQEVKELEQDSIRKVSQFQTNLDVMYRKQLKSGQEARKMESVINQKMSQLEANLKNMDVQKNGGSEIDSESFKPSDNRSQDIRKNTKPQGKQRGQENPQGKQRGQENPQGKTRGGPASGYGAPSAGKVGQGHGIGKKPSSSSIHSSDSDQVEETELLIHNFSKCIETKRYKFSTAMHFPRLGGSFKGHLRFCPDETLVFSLAFDPYPNCGPDDVHQDAEFYYQVKIIDRSQRAEDWFLCASTRSLESLMKSKWGRAYGFEMRTVHSGEMRKYLSNDPKEELLIKFEVSLLN